MQDHAKLKNNKNNNRWRLVHLIFVSVFFKTILHLTCVQRFSDDSVQLLQRSV